jgi:hypothetical protein
MVLASHQENMETVGAANPYVPGQDISSPKRYALHKRRLWLRISASALAAIGFFLDMAAGGTCLERRDSYYYDYCEWPYFGSISVSSEPTTNLLVICRN